MVNTEIRLIIFLQPKLEKLYYSHQKQDCGSDHELFIAKFRLKLKKVAKTTRPFRYDLKHITYDYTVEVRNRFKELGQIRLLGCSNYFHISLALNNQLSASC